VSHVDLSALLLAAEHVAERGQGGSDEHRALLSAQRVLEELDVGAITLHAAACAIDEVRQHLASLKTTCSITRVNIGGVAIDLRIEESRCDHT
jgi:hypothetical protein